MMHAMIYDFDTPLDRSATNSLKWTKYPGKIPMWVADMDFATPPEVRDALVSRIRSDSVVGYEEPPDRLRSLIVDWLSRRYGWVVEKRDLVFLPGLVSGINIACRAFCEPGDAAIILPPVYPPFRRAPKNNRVERQEVPLVRADRADEVNYEIDFEALERAITSRTRLLTVCHPHNPIGRRFSTADRLRLGEFCLRNNLILCSDEIHCDLLLGGGTHQPNALLLPEIAERTVTLMAPSKTFNLAGMGFGFAVATNAEVRRRFRAAAFDLAPTPNALSLAAADAVYSGRCNEWLTQLLAYLTANRDAVTAFVRDRLPGVKATFPTATYLSWLDCGGRAFDGSPFEFFLKNAGVALADGAEFGGDGARFVRLNFGCSRRQLTEALERMADALSARA
jgi:cystathionine beta-lyase